MLPEEDRNFFARVNDQDENREFFARISNVPMLENWTASEVFELNTPMVSTLVLYGISRESTPQQMHGVHQSDINSTSSRVVEHSFTSTDSSAWAPWPHPNSLTLADQVNMLENIPHLRDTHSYSDYDPLLEHRQNQNNLDVDHYAPLPLQRIHAAACSMIKSCFSSGIKIVNGCSSYVKAFALYPFNRHVAPTLINQCHASVLKSLSTADESQHKLLISQFEAARQKLITEENVAKSMELQRLNNVAYIMTVFEEISQPPTCPVCWDTFSDEIGKCTFPCKHSLCANCFSQWQKNCPLCRKKIENI